MDTSDTSSDLTDSQWHDIGESCLTASKLKDLLNDWSESDKPENDCIQSDIEVDGNGLDMDCSESDKPERKRKSSDSECSRPNKVRVIVANPQLNAGNNTDPSIIFRPWEDRNQSMENQFGAGNKAGPSHQVEPEKEKNLQQENDVGEENNSYVDISGFNGKLYTRQFKPTNLKRYQNGWKTVKAEDRKSDQATYENFCCVFFLWFTSVNW